MHACGHDSHITVMIAVIENIIQHIEQVIKGDFALKFIFQPAEEIGRGALEMINKYNVMTNVDEVYGIHNTCNIYLKQIGTTHGTMMSRVDKFNIKIHYDKEEEK